MRSKVRNNNNDPSLRTPGSISNSTLHEITDSINRGHLIDSSWHSMLIYYDLQSLREIYSEYAKIYLPRNEIILLATQYENVEKVKKNLKEKNIDVQKYTDNGNLFVVDAQKGYFGGNDVGGLFKLGSNLASRVERENRSGFMCFADMGSFFAFHAVKDMMHYELALPHKYENTMKTICCYHKKDFENLATRYRNELVASHYESIFVE